MDRDENIPAESAAGMDASAVGLSAGDAVEAVALLAAQKAAVLDLKLAGSGLPVALQDAVKASLSESWDGGEAGQSD